MYQASISYWSPTLPPNIAQALGYDAFWPQLANSTARPAQVALSNLWEIRVRLQELLPPFEKQRGFRRKEAQAIESITMGLLDDVGRVGNWLWALGNSQVEVIWVGPSGRAEDPALAVSIAQIGIAIVNVCICVRAWPQAQDLARWADLISRKEAPTTDDDAQYNKAAVLLYQGHVWLERAHRDLHRWAGTAGRAEPVLDENGVALVFCRVALLLLGHLEIVAPLVLRARSREELARFYDDDDKPRTDTAMRARTRRYAGWPEPDRRTRFRPAHGNDPDSLLEQAVFGATEEAYQRAWEYTDERIYAYKRSVTRRSYLGPARPAAAAPPDYTTALSAEEVKLAYDGFAFANRSGRVLNGKITVAWFLLQNADLKAQWGCFHRFYQNLKQWFRDVDPALVPDPADRQPWVVHVHENPDGEKLNTHFALAVPEGVLNLFRDAVRGIVLRAVEGFTWRGDLGDLVEPKVRRADRNACIGQWMWFHYMLKGTRRDKVLVEAGPDGARALDDVLAYRYEDPGPAPKRRARVRLTKNLLPEAQNAFVDPKGGRFVSLWDEQVRSGRIDVRELYSDRYLSQWEGHDDAQPTMVAPLVERMSRNDEVNPL